MSMEANAELCRGIMGCGCFFVALLVVGVILGWILSALGVPGCG